MKKKKIIHIGICICILAGLYSYWTVWRFDRVDVTVMAHEIVEEYQDYYSKVRVKTVYGFIGYAFRTTIYFLPGQKEQMLEKIREEVSDELETLIKQHGDIFYKYEISDDFKQVRIYRTPGYIWGGGRHALESKVRNRIGILIELHHNIKEGPLVSFDYSPVVFREP